MVVAQDPGLGRNPGFGVDVGVAAALFARCQSVYRPATPVVQQAWDAGDDMSIHDWHTALEHWPALRPRLAQRLRTLPDMQQRWLDAVWHGQQVAAESARDWHDEIEVLAAALSAFAFRAVDELKLRTILVQRDAHRGLFRSASEARLVALSTQLHPQKSQLCPQADLVAATLGSNRFASRESLASMNLVRVMAVP